MVQKSQEISQLRKINETIPERSQTPVAIEISTATIPLALENNKSNVESGLGIFGSVIAIISLMFVIDISYYQLTYDHPKYDDGLAYAFTQIISAITTVLAFILMAISAIGFATYKGKKNALKIGALISFIAAILPWLAHFINTTFLYPGSSF